MGTSIVDDHSAREESVGRPLPVRTGEVLMLQ